MPTSLKDKVVLVTGASSGFGAEAARLFAGEGAVVVLAARRLERLETLAEEIRAAGGRSHAVALDVADAAQVEAVLPALLAEFGRVDILFNNAGFGRLDWLENLDTASDIHAQIAVNLAGLIHVTRLVLPSMYAQRAGHIINMVSVAGMLAAPTYTIYAATKHGVRGFTNALRREAGVFGVRVSGIYPGPAVTEFSRHTGTSAIKKKLKLPGFLSLTSEQVARRVVRLAQHPRRTVVLPGYYRLAFLVDSLFPGLVDWFLRRTIVERFHKPGG